MESRSAALARKTAGEVLILRIGLGAWFLVSGLMKVWGPGLDKFTGQIQNYKLVLPGIGLDFTRGPWDAVAAYTVPWVEVVVGVCLIAGWWRRATLLLCAGMVAVFVFCIGWAWLRGLDIACGCHGGDAPVNYWGKTAELAGYYLALALFWWHHWMIGGEGKTGGILAMEGGAHGG